MEVCLKSQPRGVRCGHDGGVGLWVAVLVVEVGDEGHAVARDVVVLPRRQIGISRSANENTNFGCLSILAKRLSDAKACIINNFE